ncbi:MAG: substrate-binding domain-containing protein [Verrucomicrobiales bacterium]
MRRGQTFQQQVAALGQELPMLALPKFSGRSGESDVLRVEAWLERLPKPVAIFVSCDHIAPLVLEGCARLGFTVPEQVAVVGVNDDRVVCNVCAPTLSSIDASHFEIGYRAARLLEELMNGGEPPGAPIFIPPSRLVVRGSSGEAVIDDPLIARAARFISRNAGSPIGVDDVVASVPLSRRELQRRFRQVTGRTIHSSLLDARMEIAKRLLVAGEYTVEAVAEMSGFGSRQHFTKTFSSQTGTTPAKYRRDFGVR